MQKLLSYKFSLDTGFELYCQGRKLGDEWTLEFIKRTLWFDPKHPVIVHLKVSNFDSSSRTIVQ